MAYRLYDTTTNKFYNDAIYNTKDVAEFKKNQLKSNTHKLSIVECDKDGNVDGYEPTKEQQKVLIILKKDQSILIPPTAAANILEKYDNLIKNGYKPTEISIISETEYKAINQPELMKKANQPKTASDNAIKKAIKAAETPKKRGQVFKAKKNPDKDITSFKFYLDVEMLEQLKANAKAHNIKIGEYIRNALTEYFNNNKE